ncbi:MAG: D-alanine--D-alanine ligase [Lachnospiraceae bacterium]|nr:D-alanine--D-alanine ligase [Lachnospiraceae bacterium]
MKIVVLAGGISTERDVSLVSGTGVYKALKKKGHQAVLLDVFLGIELSSEEKAEIFSLDRDWSEGIRPVSETNPDLGEIYAMRKYPEEGFFGPNIIDICRMADIVFLALHGMNGEDGRIQAAFDLLNIKYTGTDYISSTLAMDKALTKDLFICNKVPTPVGFGVKRGEEIPKVPFPCVVKTSHGGSSVGVYLVENEEQLHSAVEEAYTYEDEIVIEQFIKGREFTDVVIDGKALPIVEIVPKQGFYDYKNKYQAGSTEEICPAQIDEKLTAAIQKTAVDAYKALRLKVYARMDFIVDEQNRIYCLEANTLPGMTPTSLIPQEAAAIGVNYEELCQWLVELSLKKYEEQE